MARISLCLLFLSAALSFEADIVPQSLTILSEGNVNFSVDFDAPVGSCFYLDEPSPNVLSFSSSSDCENNASCELDGTTFVIEITTALDEGTDIVISDFTYKQYDVEVLQTVRYYPDCDSTLNSESYTFTYDDTFLITMDVDSITLTPSSDQVGATGTTLTFEMTAYLPLEGRLEILFPELSGSIGHIKSTSDCDSLSSAFESAECSNNQLDEFYIDFVMDSAGSQTVSFVVTNYRNAFYTGQYGPVHFAVYETIDDENYGVSETDRDTEETSEQVFIEAISTPYTIEATVTLEDGGTVNTQDTLQIEWSYSSFYVLEDCYLQVVLPADFSVQTSSDISIKGKGCMASSTFTANTYNTISSSSYTFTASTLTLLYEGACPSQLGTLDCGIQIIGAYNPIVVKDSDEITVNIYADEDLTQEVAEGSGVYLDDSELSPAEIALTSFTADVDGVQEGDVTYTIIFVPEISFDEDTVVVIDMPDRLSDLSNCVATSDQMGGNAADCERDAIRFENAFNTATTAGASFTLLVGTGTNGESVRDSGTLTISAYLEIEGVEYTVAEYSGDSGFIPTAGEITSASLTPSSTTTYAQNVQYSFTFNPEHDISSLGFVEVTFPDETFLMKDSSVSYNCLVEGDMPKTCSIDEDAYTVTMGLLSSQEIEANDDATFSFTGIINPRTTEESDGLTITTYDADGYVIDTTADIVTVTMDTMAEVAEFELEYVNATNGASTSVLFSLQSSIPLERRDRFYVEFPDQVTLPDEEDVECEGVLNINDIDCRLDDQVLTFYLNGIDEEKGNFKFQVNGVTTYFNTEESDSFGSIYLTDKNKNGVMQVTSDITIQNDYPAMITEFELLQESYEEEVINTYTFKFTPTNKIPDTGVIVLTWPPTVTLHNLDQCQITARKTYSDNCSINVGKRTITIENAFQDISTYYTKEITLVKEGFENIQFIEGEFTTGFQIQTYTDTTKDYIIDQLYEWQMPPELECGFACATCNRTEDKNYCLSCFDDFKFDTLQEGKCQMGCDDGYSRNGNELKVCEKCDESCDGCFDTGRVDDIYRCLSCASGYDYTYKADSRCFLDDDCGYGYFHIKGLRCGICESPCGDCEQTATNCTKCDTDLFLQGSTCLSKCLDGYGPLNDTNVCGECDSICKSCSGEADYCTTCFGLTGDKWAYNGDCYKECPLGTAGDKSTGSCEACTDSNCDICNLEDKETCLLCSSDYLVYNGTCVDTCPPNTYVSRDETECMLTIWDLPLLYFPHLWLVFVAAVVLAVVKHFKKDTIYLSTLIAFIGVVETISYFVQMIIAAIFQSHIYALIAAFSWLFTLAINCGFFYWFTRKLEDPTFMEWEEKNKKSTKWINYTTLILNFKAVRLHFCRFFNLPFFYASFLYPGLFHKPLVWATVTSAVFSYTPIVASDIVGLATLYWGNQLYINMIETLVLSLGMCILQIVELLTLKKNISEQYNPLGLDSVPTVTQGLDPETKENMIRYIVNKVNQPRGIFPTKDIHLLRERFKPRDCESVHLPQKEPWGEDEREVRSNSSWITFGQEDSREVKPELPDNVYSASFIPTQNPFTSLGKEFDDIWGTTDPDDFKAAQRRKKHSLFKGEEDDEAQRIKQKTLEKIKRGRMSKYIKEINKEDEDNSLDEVEEVKTENRASPEYDFGGALQSMTVEEIQDMEEQDRQKQKQIFRSMSKDQQALDRYATEEKERLQRNQSSVDIHPFKQSQRKSFNQQSSNKRTQSPSKSNKSRSYSPGKSLHSLSPSQKYGSPEPVEKALDQQRNVFEEDLMLNDLQEIERDLQEQDMQNLQSFKRNKSLDPRNQDLYDHLEDEEISQHERNSQFDQLRRSPYLVEENSQLKNISPNALHMTGQRFESDFEQTKDAEAFKFREGQSLKKASKKASLRNSKENSGMKAVKTFAEGSLSAKKQKKTGPSYSKPPGQQQFRTQASRRNSNYARPSLREGSNKKLKTFLRSNTGISANSRSHSQKPKEMTMNLHQQKMQRRQKPQLEDTLSFNNPVSKSVTPKGRRGDSEFKGAGKQVLESRKKRKIELDTPMGPLSASQTPQAIREGRLQKNQQLMEEGARFVSLSKSKKHK